MQTKIDYEAELAALDDDEDSYSSDYEFYSRCEEYEKNPNLIYKEKLEKKKQKNQNNSLKN